MESTDAEYLDLQKKAKAIRSEYGKRLNSGDAPKRQDLYEKIAGLSQQLEHRLPPEEIQRLVEELKQAISEWETRR
jgi:hypothetical protein